MKLNHLEVKRYNTGYHVSLEASADVLTQFTPVYVRGTGHHRLLVGALWQALRSWRQEKRALNLCQNCLQREATHVEHGDALCTECCIGAGLLP
ncbi:hypothetical protein GCM10010914_21980 [Deinococcus wulumuqiensis]|uniref:Uncharacterized protein n=1 Tax=Deinococcus wulumuqiensis TaxID=980427 RepID=A0AAV4K7S4_9DEIO|nr:hypothetical protein GCM10010914_21980 [Deinococcus wulumuqiensis]GGP29971.1 hypothetical protein GCM10008021_16220 [Deinococcus wulumuqiensis]